jgi:A/G-specific adenine glycosylase
MKPSPDRALKKEPGHKVKISSDQQAEQSFSNELVHWNRKENDRQMPWKGEKDPYKIWLSEIILQQTRVDQGLKYYENFIRTFPDIISLANAPEEKVFKLWQGLGYYSRCRNLIITAKKIASERNGKFPDRYEDILALKGVGSYTAAAIASFAFNLPYAVLDGNVFRVLSRVFDMEIPVDTSVGRNEFMLRAQSVLPEKFAGEYNQAIMDFGATICKPKPVCHSCFFQLECKAFQMGKQDVLPLKKNKIKVKKRWFNYLVLTHDHHVLIRKRTAGDIWQQLFEFPLVETEKPETNESISELALDQFGIGQIAIENTWEAKQKLTHQQIHFRFSKVLIKKQPVPGFTWVKISKLSEYPFPKTLQEFISSSLNNV